MEYLPIFGAFPFMKKNTSISLGNHFDEFIKMELDSGRYKTASEVIRDGLRLLESRRDREIALAKAIEEGRKSGYINDFNMKSFLDEIERKYGS